MIDPLDSRLHFVEDPLSRKKIEAVRPFDDGKSWKSGSPIRIVVCTDGDKFIKQGNHRVYAARKEQVGPISVLIYTPQEWEDSFGSKFRRQGHNNPRIDP